MNNEILAPAGSKESAIAAINAGCDAIYMGGSAFNARRFAQNMTDDEVKEIITLCHRRGVRVHITLNTLYKEKELKEVLAFAAKMYAYGADAFIIQDLGFFSLAKEYFKTIDLHASTQLTIHSPQQALAFEKLGFDRVVLSRELTLEEVKEITSALKIETEAFVHGALCVSYSGRCLMSSILGGRSGNRGCCAQTCRMEYRLENKQGVCTRGYLLSPKDTCMLEHTGELCAAGITSWKIEGRMKSPEYVYQVTSLYKRYADSKAKPDREAMAKITQIFNRGGELSTGCYYSHSSKSMLSTETPKSSGVLIGRVVWTDGKKCRISLTSSLVPGDGIEIWAKGEHTGMGISRPASPGETIPLSLSRGTNVKKGDKVYKSFDKALNDSLKHTYDTATRRSRVKCELKIKKGEPVLIYLTAWDGVRLNLKGPVAEEAVNNPMTYGDITMQLGKTGNTPFILEFEKGVCEGVYIPLSALKDFKRKICTALEEAIDDFHTREEIATDYTPKTNTEAESTRLAVQVYTRPQLTAALDAENIDIYCPLDEHNFADAGAIINKAHSKGSRLYFMLPVIEKSFYHKELEKRIAAVDSLDHDGYVLRNLTDVKTDKALIADFTLNCFNMSAFELLNKSFKRVTLSPELNLKELKPLCGKGSEVVVYGRMPLMTTQHCPVGVYAGDKEGNKYCRLRHRSQGFTLVDRKNAKFPVMPLCESCNALILNNMPIYMGDKWQDISALKSEALRLIFTVEDEKTTAHIIKLHQELIKGGSAPTMESVTGGHFYRGVM